MQIWYGVRRHWKVILGFVTVTGSIGIYQVVNAQSEPGCFIINGLGQVVNLNRICESNREETAIPQDRRMTDAKTYFQQGRDLAGDDEKGALTAYSKAIELNPTYAEAYFMRGNLLADIGQPQEGIVDIQQAATLFDQQGKPENAVLMRNLVAGIEQAIRDGEFDEPE